MPPLKTARRMIQTTAIPPVATMNVPCRLTGIPVLMPRWYDNADCTVDVRVWLFMHAACSALVGLCYTRFHHRDIRNTSLCYPKGMKDIHAHVMVDFSLRNRKDARLIGLHSSTESSSTHTFDRPPLRRFVGYFPSPWSAVPILYLQSWSLSGTVLGSAVDSFHQDDPRAS